MKPSDHQLLTQNLFKYNRRFGKCLNFCLLTFNEHFPASPVVFNNLDVSIVGITEEDAVGAPSLQAVVEGQRYHIFEVLWVFVGPHWRVQVGLIWEVDAF